MTHTDYRRRPSILQRVLTRTVILVGVTATGSAIAAAPDPCVEAAQLIGSSTADMSSSECEEIVETAESERWQLSLDMALAHEQSAALESAVAYYRRFLAETTGRAKPLSDGWAKVQGDVRAAVARLEEKLLKSRARIGVRTQPEGAIAVFDGGVGVATPAIQYLAPGAHTLEVSHPTTGQRLRRTFDVMTGQALTLDFDLRESATTPTLSVDTSPTGEGPAPKPAEETSSDAGSIWRTVGVTGIGLGVASGVVGTILYLSGDGAIDDASCGSQPGCDPNEPRRARRRADGEDRKDQATIAWIAGGVLVVGGIVALISAPDSPTSEVAAGPQLRSVQPLVGPDGAGLGATVLF
ncbi:MAG: hypothetical protein ACI9MR_001889 [Myxococcota bacterium]|jgi:hypothetical protein